jgi:subtilisin family serine protease
MRALIVRLAPAKGPGEQASIFAQLGELRRRGHVRRVRSLWIANAVAVTADASALAALRARPDVRSIEPDSVLPIHPAAVAAAPSPGIAATGAAMLWGQSVDGSGTVVATLDTGVDLTRPALASRYRGGTNSWFDAYNQHATPVDDPSRHGSDVLEVMVAGGGTGMAPGARFITARVFNNLGNITASAVHAAFQWVLDPDGNPVTDDAPDVVNASWGSLLGACDTEFQPDLRALRASGILPVFAAGNDGGTATPSDNSPANLPEAFAVGATANETQIAPFSSVGPSSCGGPFPELVAPGVDVLGFDGVPLTGTSYSAPHVAGALALLLQIAPQLTADEQAALLLQSARDLGAPGPDTTFGAGALDVEAAALLLSPALDFAPPALSGATHSGSTLQVRAVDSQSAIDRGEWWADVDPGVGGGAPMAAADGALDSPTEILGASTSSLQPGRHVLGMRAHDAAGHWSTAATLAVNVLDSSLLGVQTLPLDRPLRGARLRLVASDGFEHGLRAWPRRSGSVAATAAAAMSGRLGLRTTSVAGAPAFVARRLPHPGTEVSFAFTVDARAFSTAGMWVEIAAITSGDGGRLASVELRSGTGRASQLRLTARTGAQGVVHTRPQRLHRRPVALVLALDRADAVLAAGGSELGRLTHAANLPHAAGVTLGPWRAGPPASAGSLDIDRVSVREGPAGP